MGVYIFESVVNPNYCKLGYTSCYNPWMRVYKWSFNLLKHYPPHLKDRMSINEVKLLRWYPNLSKEFEKDIHRALRSPYGEWYHRSIIESLIRLFDLKAISDTNFEDRSNRITRPLCTYNTE